MIRGFSYVITIFMGLLCYSVTGFAAAFNYPSSLINIPVSQYFSPGVVEFGTSAAIYSANDAPTYEFDYMFNLALTDQFQIGITYINSSTLVSNFHYTFFAVPDLFNLKVSGGLQNIYAESNISSFDDYLMTQDTNLSPFLVSSFDLIFDIHAHCGIGKRRFEDVAGTLGKLSGAFKLVNGVFAGLDYDFFSGKVMFEFDGKDINLGYRLFFTDTWELNMALTEIMQTGVTNPNFSDAPTRKLTINFVLRENFFTFQQEYVTEQIESAEQQLKDLQTLKTSLITAKDQIVDELDELRRAKASLYENVDSLKQALKDEVKYLYESDKEQQEEQRRKYLGINSAMGEKVLKFYYDSFEYYYQKEYLKAIEALSKAIAIDPYVPMLFIRLGTIYYELDMFKEANENWERALALDPNNQELRKIKEKLNAQ